MNKRQLGTVYEQKAAAYLQQQGYEILECNFRCRLGEIDIVAREGGYLCFVEVKYRSGDGYGSPLEAVGVYKQRKIIKVAHYYMMRKRLGLYMPCRFDVIAIEKDQITLLRNAFGES